MEIFQLKIFISVTQTLSFTKTADLFYLSQPAISHQIKSLEKELGVPLFERHKQKVSLTSHGKELYSYASDILETALIAKSRMKNIAEGKEGLLKIATLASNITDLSPCLPIFSMNFPRVQIDVDILNGNEMINSLHDNKHDFYFASSKIIEHSNFFSYVITRKNPLHIYTPKEMLPKIDLNNWDIIEKLPFLSIYPFDTPLYNCIINVFKNRGIFPNIIGYYNRGDSIFISVNAGLGISILPQRPLDKALYENIVAVPISGEDAVITSVAAWSKNIHNTIEHNFIKILQKLFL